MFSSLFIMNPAGQKTGTCGHFMAAFDARGALRRESVNLPEIHALMEIIARFAIV